MSSMADPVTVKCIYCRENISGHFIGSRDVIKLITTDKVIGVIGEYNKKKGYLHQACKTGIEAEEALQVTK